MSAYKPIDPIYYNSFVEGVLNKRIKFKLKKDYSYKIPDELSDEGDLKVLSITCTLLVFGQLLFYPIVAIICKSWFKLIGLLFFAIFISTMYACGDKLKKSKSLSIFIYLIIFVLFVYSFLKFGFLEMTTLVLFNLTTLMLFMFFYPTSEIRIYINA
jgi:hypothetical protein